MACAQTISTHFGTLRVNCCYKVLCVQFLSPCWWKAVNINSNTANTSWKTFDRECWINRLVYAIEMNK